jgi:hypothetical protein
LRRRPNPEADIVHVRKVLFLFLVVACFASTAFATSIGVGQLKFVGNGTPVTTFDIVNRTGTQASAPDFPITTQLTITVTNLVANIQGGSTITIPGSNFTVVDAQGDLNCTVAGDAASGGCDLSSYSVVSATLAGTLSPTTGLGGLPPGTTILPAFSTTIAPDPACTGGPSSVTIADATLTPGCDATTIFATTPATTAVPEPGTVTLLEIGLLGIAGVRALRS